MDAETGEVISDATKPPVHAFSSLHQSEASALSDFDLVSDDLHQLWWLSMAYAEPLFVNLVQGSTMQLKIQPLFPYSLRSKSRIEL
jgi:hypothetical protein